MEHGINPQPGDRERIDAELRKLWAAFDHWTEQEQGLARTVWLCAEHATRGVSVAPAQLTCWGLSSFCAEVGHKCRAAGCCVYAPPGTPA